MIEIDISEYMNFHNFIYSMPLSTFSIMYCGLQATYTQATGTIFSELCHITHDKMFLLSFCYPYHLLF